MRRRIISLSVVTVVLVLIFSLSALSLKISQIEFDLNMAAGTSGIFSFQVRNPDTTPQHVIIYLNDWLRHPRGGHIFLPPNSAQWTMPRQFISGEEFDLIYEVSFRPGERIRLESTYRTASPTTEGKILGSIALDPAYIGIIPDIPVAAGIVTISRIIEAISPAGNSFTVRLRIRVNENFHGLVINETFTRNVQVTPLESADAIFTTVDRSNVDWLTVVPSSFTLAAGATQEVRFSVNIPYWASGMYWGMIFVRGSPRPAVVDGVGVLAVARFGVKVYTTITRTEVISGRAIGIDRPTSLNPLTFLVAFENTGNVQLRVSGWLDIINVRGETVLHIPISNFPVLPGSMSIFEVIDQTGEQLPPGIYQALVVFDYGGAALVGMARGFRVR
ncbi:hypothetical protein LM597_00450 [Candidatus Acetothermia bacterium]|nr:hypothetical protein [Candidatus Acetothermia bacterium]